MRCARASALSVLLEVPPKQVPGGTFPQVALQYGIDTDRTYSRVYIRGVVTIVGGLAPGTGGEVSGRIVDRQLTAPTARHARRHADCRNLLLSSGFPAVLENTSTPYEQEEEQQRGEEGRKS